MSAERGIFWRGNRFLLLWQYSTDTQSTSCFCINSCTFFHKSCWRGSREWIGNPPNSLCTFYFPQSKIEYCWSKNCSAGNPPPRGSTGQKRTRMDAILKKFEFKMKFKFKTIVKVDLTNIRSI
jgi:hypothetical protein